MNNFILAPLVMYQVVQMFQKAVSEIDFSVCRNVVVFSSLIFHGQLLYFSQNI